VDTLTFIVELSKAIAWPVSVVLLVLIMRRPLVGLIPLLRRVKYKDFEVDFDRRLEEVKEEAALQLPSPPAQQAPPSEPETRMVKLAEVSPRAAVLESWRALENLLQEAAKGYLIAQGRQPANLSAIEAIQLLQQSERLSPETLRLLRRLRSLRNDAAHAPQFALTTGSALEYVSIVGGVAERLKSSGVGA